MPTLWVILGRVIRAENAAAAGAPDFTLPVAAPPRVTILAAGRGAHPDPNRPDEHPYIIAAGPLCLLAHFAVAPSIGTSFGDNPRDTHLVLVRHFHTADGQTTARAERVPTPQFVPILSNIGSVGLISNDEGGYTIVDLGVDITRSGIPFFTLNFFNSGSDEYPESPLSAEELQDLKWTPHGAVSTDDTLWWFDLRWGIFSSDLSDREEEPELLFHRLPDGHAVDEMTPLMVGQRCVTVSQNQLRYVEIIREGGDDIYDDDIAETATVSLWTRINDGPDPDGWEWQHDYTVSFEEIWDDDTYTATGLPRIVPAIAVVSPLNPNLVYFTLMKKHLLGVDVHQRRVVQHEAYYGLVNNAKLEPGARRPLRPPLDPATHGCPRRRRLIYI